MTPKQVSYEIKPLPLKNVWGIVSMISKASSSSVFNWLVCEYKFEGFIYSFI